MTLLGLGTIRDTLEPEAASGTNPVAGASGANLMTRVAEGSYLLEIKCVLKPE